ncbi:MAG TPA: bifunctional demethylmenaquinone methyltransferase/2-methoxy-6-polyprenyl-1,4-benzoquinol methylase UbiE [Chitinophagaceae bacterium]|nr:bifunctional demethylmenaquinone methyltransferase/2-methoxy-6-polyprenyl-1,4-benzoquinol methylase UbiE [Chitinophagaceae bacterium]
MNETLPHDSVVPFKQSYESKKSQVAAMFDKIAFRYDFMNRFLSCGIDVSWRKKAIRELVELRPQTVLDVATGTADVALLLHKYLHPKKIVGIDISEGMLELGRQKVEKQKLNNVIELQNGDSEAIKFPDNSFDAITVAFGVRNFEHLQPGLSEMLRVLRPEGKLVILEFSKPRQKLFKGFYNFYMNIFAPKAGKWLSKNKDAYQYLTESVKAFPDGDEFLHILKQTGYVNTYLKTLSLGICTIYCGSKGIS